MKGNNSGSHPGEERYISDDLLEKMGKGSVWGLDYYGRLQAAALAERTIYLGGEIYVVDSETMARELKWLALLSKEPILIMVSSPGGLVLPGLALYDEIRHTRSQGIEVVMRVSGHAASMAVIVLQAATTREAYPNSRLLIHEISQFKFFSEDKTSDLEEQVEEMKKLQAVLLGILSERSGKSREEIDKLIWKRDIWFSAEEALEFGLIDRIVGV